MVDERAGIEEAVESSVIVAAAEERRSENRTAVAVAVRKGENPPRLIDASLHFSGRRGWMFFAYFLPSKITLSAQIFST